MPPPPRWETEASLAALYSGVIFLVIFTAAQREDGPSGVAIVIIKTSVSTTTWDLSEIGRGQTLLCAVLSYKGASFARTLAFLGRETWRRDKARVRVRLFAPEYH
jgi:hypothetical protein